MSRAIWPISRFLRDGQLRVRRIRQRRWFGFDKTVDADHGLFAALDCFDTARIRLDQLLLEIAGFDGRDRAAHLFDRRSSSCAFFRSSTLAVDHRRAVENVAHTPEVGLVGEDLLHAQRPLLIPWPRQSKRLVPGWKLHGARAGLLRQRYRQHFDQNAGDVVLRLLLGQAERVHLHAIAEAPVLGIGDAVALRVISSHSSVKARILQTSVMKRSPALTKNEMRADHLAEFLFGAFPGSLYRVQHARWRWQARRPAPAPASRRLPAGDTSRRSSDSTSASPWS